MTTAIYPGTFDPPTNGHIDLIERASKMFSKVVVACAANPGKQPCFDLETRVTLIQRVVAHLSNVEICGFDSLLIEFAKQNQCDVIIRGLRAVTDFDFEIQLASMNRRLAPKIETLFLTPDDNYAYLSSTLVKEVASLHGDVSAFVPEDVATALKRRYQSS